MTSQTAKHSQTQPNTAKHSQTNWRLLSLTASWLQTFRSQGAAHTRTWPTLCYLCCTYATSAALLLPAWLPSWPIPIPNQQSLVFLLGFFRPSPPHGTDDQIRSRYSKSVLNISCPACHLERHFHMNAFSQRNNTWYVWYNHGKTRVYVVWLWIYDSVYCIKVYKSTTPHL